MMGRVRLVGPRGVEVLASTARRTVTVEDFDGNKRVVELPTAAEGLLASRMFHLPDGSDATEGGPGR